MCTTNINTLAMDRQVFWQINYLHASKINLMNKNKYGLPSHDLRRFGITALINEGVSPYRIWDVVRHKIPGMSEVTMMYNRPTTEDLIEAMEVIAK